MSISALPPLIFDIHGVLIGREEPRGHLAAGETLEQLRAAGYPLRFLTNSSRLTRAELVAQLAAVGIVAASGEVYTAGVTTGHYLASRAEPGRLHVIGSVALRAEIEAACGARVQWVAAEKADTVIVSHDPGLDEDTLARLAASKRRPTLIATCLDSQFPSGGKLNAGPGRTVQRVEAALGQHAWVIGKPNPYVLTDVMCLTPTRLAGAVIVGDSPEQDVALGRNAGARTVQLLNEDVPRRGSLRPDYGIRAIDQLLSLLCG